jgi:hypothetical protein
LLDDAAIRLLLDFLARNLFEQLPSISPHHCCSTFIGPLQATHCHTITALHNIAAAAVRHLPSLYTEEWIRTQLLRCIVAGFGSPDELEVASVKKLLDAASEVVPELRDRVYAFMRDRLSLSQLLPYPSISNYLSFIHARLRAAVAALPEIQWFTTAVLPLFASPFLPAFHAELEQLCGLFAGYCDEAPALIAQYLLGHWPATSSVKLPLFLESLGRAVTGIGGEKRRAAARSVFARIADAVASEHAGVVTAALRVLEDPRFLAMFDAEAVAAVYGPVAAIAAEPSPARAQAINVLAAITRKCSGAAAVLGGAPADGGRDERWRLVIDAAAE